MLWFINGEYTTDTSDLMLAAVRQSGYYQCVAVGDNGAGSLGTIWITPERKDLLLCTHTCKLGGGRGGGGGGLQDFL